MKNMNLNQVLRILGAHWLAALLTFLVVAAIGIAITLLAPRQYVATTGIVFDVKSADPVVGQLLPVLPGYIATQMEIIRSERVAQRVVKMIRLDENPTIQANWKEQTEGKGKIEAWVGKLLLNKLTVNASRDTSIIHISYTATDPTFAVIVADAFAQAYLDANIELRVDPARQHARWFEGQGKTLRDRLESAQLKLTQFQQQHGIVAKDEQYDAETMKLNELSSQLTVAMIQSADAQSKQRSGSDALPEVMRSSVVAGLRSDIARLESRLQETAVNLGRNHPQYQRMEQELVGLRGQLEAENRRVASGFSSTRSVSRDNEGALRAAIAAQTKKLIGLKFQRNQLAGLQREVDSAQSAFDTVSARHNLSTLESQMTQASASVLSYATEPTGAAFPTLTKGLAISLGASLLLAAGLAFLLEALDRRVRCIDDLVQVLPFPVLSVIHGSRRQRPNRLLPWRRRAAIGYS